jgi:hypothetical protein
MKATPRQLAQAFASVTRPGWPSTLAEALARPAYAFALEGLAALLARQATRRRLRPARHPQLRPARFDAKRAAANDLDD